MDGVSEFSYSQSWSPHVILFLIGIKSQTSDGFSFAKHKIPRTKRLVDIDQKNRNRKLRIKNQKPKTREKQHAAIRSDQ